MDSPASGGVCPTWASSETWTPDHRALGLRCRGYFRTPVQLAQLLELAAWAARRKHKNRHRLPLPANLVVQALTIPGWRPPRRWRWPKGSVWAARSCSGRGATTASMLPGACLSGISHAAVVEAAGLAEQRLKACRHNGVA